MAARAFLDKPEYVFRPGQLVRRLLVARNAPPACAETRLPWGLTLRYRPQEEMGACIWRMGLYDLCVTETLWRLLDPGENAADVGANIGHMTGVMAVRVGRRGTVLALEPHPEIVAELLVNVRRWREDPRLGTLEALPVAASDSAGTATLHVSTAFDANRGTATLAATDAPTVHACAVETVRLDALPDLPRPLALLKIDVEGHERAALEGATGRLAAGDIRDIVFEEHAPYPTPVTDFLEAHGYTVFRLGKGFLRPTATPPTAPAAPDRYEPTNYLATRDAPRALTRLRRPFWATLRAGRP